MNIKNLYGNAWTTALEQTATVFNRLTGANYNVKDNWLDLASFADNMRYDFDNNGNLKGE